MWAERTFGDDALERLPGIGPDALSKFDLNTLTLDQIVDVSVSLARQGSRGCDDHVVYRC